MEIVIMNDIVLKFKFNTKSLSNPYNMRISIISILPVSNEQILERLIPFLGNTLILFRGTLKILQINL